MNTKTFLFALLVLIATASFPLQAGTINFDEFTSPPVTCCYGDTGVIGPLVYPNVTITDASNTGFVMNGTGWNNMQTSGANLFGTTSGSMFLTFNTAVSNFSVDVINGTGEASFTLNLYDHSNVQIFQSVFNLNDFTTAGSVATLNPATTGIWKAEILGDFDFAIDTVSFGTSQVPEPSSLALVASAIVALGLSRLRRS